METTKQLQSMNMRTGKTKALAKSAKSILLLLAMLVMGQTEAWAEELTVYDGTATNEYVPVAGYYADTNNQKTEFIVPAASLSSMTGGTISKIQFYLSSSASAAWGATYEVFLKEIAETEFSISSSYYSSTATAKGKDGATVVYTGKLDATGSTMDINLTEEFEYGGSNLLVGIYMTTKGSNYPSATFLGTEKANGSWCYYSSSSGNKPQNFAPKTTFTYTAATPGPKFAAYDGSAKLTSPYAYDFGLATEGTAKTFILKNPGTESLTVDVSETGSFGATLSSTTIAAGSEVTLTVTMPSTTGSSSVTITPAVGSGIAPFIINVSGTVRDPNKVYEYGFTSLPTDWTTNGTWYYSADNGAYTTAWYLSSNARLITPQLTVSEGETFYVEAKGYSTSNTSYQHLQMQYSANGTTWTNFDAEPSLDPTAWKTFSFTGAPAGKYYIAINASQCDVRMFYGGELPNEPKMVVTQPANLDFGVYDKDATAPTKTFTIANTGKATLNGISVSSGNAAFTVTGAPSSLAAGASQEVTITMSTASVGNLSSDIKVNATGMDEVAFTVTGTVLPTGLSVVDFNDNQLPARWENTGWTFSNGAAYAPYHSPAYVMRTPKVVVNAGDMFIVKGKIEYNSTSYHVTVKGLDSNDDEVYNKKLTNDVFNTTDYTAVLLTDVPATVEKLQFVGYYGYIDEIQGINYAADLVVTDSESAAQASGLTYDFGECAANASVTYNFANVGAGTINITNVTITGDGAAAYSTNWTESVAAPFDLTITRSYDAKRAGAAQAAVVTVTTTEGAFVINVTGTDKAANAPELAVSTNAIDFGKVTANASETVTVTNNGTGSMTVNIASDSEDFTVSAASLTEIGAGESKTFTVTFKYGNPYGVKNGNITITPTYNAEAAETITVTGKAKDPATWSEDFEGNALPTGWEAGSNWSFADGVAKGAYNYSSTTYLTTPKLEVSAATDELTFDYKATGNYVSISIQMSKNGEAWKTCNTTPAIGSLDNGATGTGTITGLEAGIYQFRFKNDAYNLDNFDGFKLKAAAAHEAEVKAQTIPATGNQYVEYTASVDVKVTGTNNEELTVKFFIGDTQYGNSVVKTVTANGTETFEVTFTPDAAVSGDAYFTIESTDIAAFESDKVAVSIAAATVLDETVGLPDGLVADTKPSVVVKYTAKSGWNTICMPFELTSGILTSIFGDGWKAYEFYGYADGALKFRTPSTFYAGYPYIIYVETAATHAEGVKLFGTNVAQTTAKADTYSDVSFQGRYAPVAAGEWAADWYGVTSSGKLQKGNTETSYMKGFRAYFTGIAASASLSLNFEDSTTGITTVVAGSQLTEDDNIYNLNGQKVNAPDKGLYIINGRKVVVK